MFVAYTVINQFVEFIESHAVLYADVSHSGAAKGNKMSTTAKPLPDITGKSAYVGAFAANDT